LAWAQFGRIEIVNGNRVDTESGIGFVGEIEVVRGVINGGCCCEKWDVVTLKCAMTLVVKGLVMANIDGSEKR
jgi:hypothetical protein